MKTISDVVERRYISAPLKDFSREIPWYDEGDIIDRLGHKVYIKHLDGPLFFGFASRFQEMIKVIPEIEVVIIRMDKVPYVDQSGLYAMEEAIMGLQKKDIKVVFTDLKGQPLAIMERFNLIPRLIEREYCFENFSEASDWLEKYLLEESLKPKETDSEA